MNRKSVHIVSYLNYLFQNKDRKQIKRILRSFHEEQLEVIYLLICDEMDRRRK